MNIRLTKDKDEANLITHGGTFHPDDVFSTVFLSKLIDEPILFRTVDQNVKSDTAIIYDIGFGKYDHHGADALYRDNSKIKYCSFGLLWRDLGRDFLKKRNYNDIELMFNKIDEDLIMQIDGIDNGYFPSIKAPYKLKDLDGIIDLFNNCWNEEIDSDIKFLEALNIADLIFERMLKRAEAEIEAFKIVSERIDSVSDGILILDRHMPYFEAIFNSEKEKAKEIKIIIMPSIRGGYNIKPITIAKDSKELAVNFPKEYFGLSGKELQEVSGIKTANFVHSTGFIAATTTLEDAILIGKKAIENGKQTIYFKRK